MERLRQLVGSNGWDYCILWKLSEDQRFLEFMDCCCSGSECNIINNIENGITIGEELLFSCRDGMFEHPTTKTCQILSHFPSSQPLDGINMEILISNQPRWLNFSNVSDLSVNDESLGTKILIPIPGGLVELYAAKQVSEDLNVIDYVMAQCNILVDQGQMSNSTNVDPSFSVNMNMINELQSDTNPISTINHSIEFLPQFNYTPENNNINNNNDDDNNNNEVARNTNNFENGFQEFDELIQQPNNNVNDLHGLENSENGLLFQGDDQKGSSLPKQEISSRADSVSDSDQLDDDDDPKYRRRVTKGPQSKNLVAERKRRKKLNERLYNLRSLVPNISKLDRASILGDAITYVKELQKEANDLQEELERNSDDEGIVHHHHHHHHQPHHNNLTADVSNVNDPLFRPDYDVEKPNNGFLVGDSENLRSNYDLDRVTAGANDKAQQMEVQVEVGQLEGNEFHVKVFGEQKRGGFVRLMEALNALGLDITNVNMTSCISLVSYVFIVKKRDSENVHAEYLRDSLLEATRSNQAVFWSENGNGIDHRLHNHHFEPFHDHFHHLGS